MNGRGRERGREFKKRDRKERGEGSLLGPHALRKKVCRFCRDGSFLDYKETERLWKFLTEKGKIVPRRISGNCAKHQRHVAALIKRGRHAALLPFQAE